MVDVERRIVDGTPARVETLRRRSHGDGVINTAYIERLNATFRERLAALTRRGRALARRPLTLQHGMYLIGTVYNFCTPHASLGLRWESDDTGDGRRDHGSLLECARIVVVSRAVASLDATQAAWASLACAQTSDRAVVWEPRLAVEVDVDREINAVDVEPCSTHVHPDRPSDLPEEELTLESAFAKAGIRVTRSPGSGTAISSGAGINRRWNYSELHDSMELHWDAFGNRPQWKMWIFLAELADTDSLGGVMFDGDIDEPGGVDRQGTALFTRCPYFHTEQGGYIQANPPTAEAVKRELFFNLIHETGHAFNLAHSFQKQLSSGPGEGAWMPPVWMPLTNNNQALSWMNYPDSATPGGGAGANATWFYQRFRFRFDASELLFLRHAPESYVQMGNAAWFQNHGRVSRISLDRRLELVVRNRKDIVELGEPVLLELRLRNRSDQAVMVHHNLDPSDGLVEVAVTNPAGERRPFLPIDHTRTNLLPQQLGPGQATYHPLDLTMGQFGFPFKEPGAYRIEVSYTNIDGRTAAAVMQLYVRPPASFDDRPVVNELFNARIGRALYVDGTRVMEDVNDKLDWVRDRLGAQHPISYHLTTVRYKPMATPSKVVEPGSDQVRAYDPEPDRVVTELEPVIEQTEAAADTMGHMWYRNVVDTYTQTCVEVHQQTKARHAQEKLLGLFKERNVIPSVVEAVEKRMDELR